MSDLARLPYAVEPMRVADVDEIMAIEYEAFTMPWSASAYRHEIERNQMAHYYVVRGRAPAEGGAATILAYGGFWLMVDEAHISTIATRREWRGRGIGELLLAAMLRAAQALKAEHATLEVRVSNHAAQSLYRKYGFAVAGRRKRYYEDNREDALIMTTPPFCDEAYGRLLGALEARLRERMSAET